MGWQITTGECWVGCASGEFSIQACMMVLIIAVAVNARVVSAVDGDDVTPTHFNERMAMQLAKTKE